MSAIDGERSPKRQRLESYSPASPPLHETKGFVGLPPNTPPPSVRMSPSWQSQSLSHQQSASSNATVQSPPSTAGLHSQMMGKAASSDGEGSGSGHGTPVTDVDIDMQNDGRHAGAQKEAGASDDLDMVDAEHRRTDHERDDHVPLFAVLALPKLETASTLIESSRPHPSQNLVQAYGLEEIQASVARRDLVTGEKLVKLRKSYENKIKSFNLAGYNKPTSKPHILAGLVDPGWDPNAASGLSYFEERHQDTAIGNVGAEADLFAKLDTALQMEPGRLPAKEHLKWKNQLGLDDPTITVTNADHLVRGMLGPPPKPKLVIPDLQSSAPSSPASSVLGRPERTNKKRRYDEASYAGYDDEEDAQPLKQRRLHVGT